MLVVVMKNKSRLNQENIIMVSKSTSKKKLMSHFLVALSSFYALSVSRKKLLKLLKTFQKFNVTSRSLRNLLKSSRNFKKSETLADLNEILKVA